MASLFKRQAIIIKLGKDVRIIGFVSKQKQVSFRAYYINMSSPPLYLLHYIFRINLKMISQRRDVTFQKITSAQASVLSNAQDPPLVSDQSTTATHLSYEYAL